MNTVSGTNGPDWDALVAAGAESGIEVVKASQVPDVWELAIEGLLTTGPVRVLAALIHDTPEGLVGDGRYVLVVVDHASYAAVSSIGDEVAALVVANLGGVPDPRWVSVTDESRIVWFTDGES